MPSGPTVVSRELYVMVKSNVPAGSSTENSRSEYCALPEPMLIWAAGAGVADAQKNQNVTAPTIPTKAASWDQSSSERYLWESESYSGASARRGGSARPSARRMIDVSTVAANVDGAIRHVVSMRPTENSAELFGI